MRAAVISGTLTFLVALLLSTGTRGLLLRVDVPLALAVWAAVIGVGVAFDILAVAVTASAEAPFHAQAADKLPGSRHAVWLVRHADRVASFAGDVVGDAAGTIGGALAAAIALRLATLPPTLAETVLVSLTAGLTVAGKAWGKRIGLRRSEAIVAWTGRILHLTEKAFGVRIVPVGKNAKESPGKRGGPK